MNPPSTTAERKKKSYLLQMVKVTDELFAPLHHNDVAELKIETTQLEWCGANYLINLI